MTRELLSNCFSGPALWRFSQKWEVCGQCVKAGESHLAEGPVGEQQGMWKRFRQALILAELLGGGQAGGGSSQSGERAQAGSVHTLKYQKMYLGLHNQNIPPDPEFPG